MSYYEIALSDDAVERIARRAAELVRPVPVYLTPSETAEYMRCAKQRVYDLTSQGRLPVCKDGTRNLYRRSDVDAYLAGMT